MLDDPSWLPTFSQHRILAISLMNAPMRFLAFLGAIGNQFTATASHRTWIIASLVFFDLDICALQPLWNGKSRGLVLCKGVYHLLQDVINASTFIDLIERRSPFCPRVWGYDADIGVLSRHVIAIDLLSIIPHLGWEQTREHVCEFIHRRRNLADREWRTSWGAKKSEGLILM